MTVAAEPPSMWTTAEPAKSWNGYSSWLSQPPPQVQRTAKEKTTPDMKVVSDMYASSRIRPAIAPETIVEAVAWKTR